MSISVELEKEGLEKRLKDFIGNVLGILKGLNFEAEEQPYERVVDGLARVYGVSERDRWKIERIWRGVYNVIAVGDIKYRSIDVFSRMNEKRWIRVKELSAEEILRGVIEEQEMRVERAKLERAKKDKGERYNGMIEGKEEYRGLYLFQFFDGIL